MGACGGIRDFTVSRTPGRYANSILKAGGRGRFEALVVADWKSAPSADKNHSY